MKKLLMLLPVFLLAFSSKYLNNYNINISCDQVIHNEGIDICYSYSDKTPKMVVYNVDGEYVDKNIYSRPSFKEDKAIPEMYRSEPNDFVGSGKDKGHFKPNAIVDYDRALQKATFKMSNVAPQYPKFNRQLWSKIERFVRLEAIKYKHLTVITGACGTEGYIKGYVNIPEYWYKIIFYPNGKQIAFLSANTDAVAKDSIKDHLVSVWKVERTCKFYLSKKKKDIFSSLFGKWF